MSPQLIFGTATLGMDTGEFRDRTGVASLLKLLRQEGVTRLDTAARYPPLNPGGSERLLGECSDLSSGFTLDTKVYTNTQMDGGGDLTLGAVEKSTNDSLMRLDQRSSPPINILHIHRADPTTPIEEQVQAFSQRIKEGHCKAWGVSNVPISTLEAMLRVCEETGSHKPVCYQTQYNIITRGAEKELLPLLRKHGMSLNAFGPLASGFMTGNFMKGEHAGTRFADDNPLGKHVQKMFGEKDLHEALRSFDSQVSAHSLTTTEVAMRWVFYHSALQDQDGIIFGASKESQIVGTKGMLRKGPLPADILQSCEALWDAVKDIREAL